MPLRFLILQVPLPFLKESSCNSRHKITFRDYSTLQRFQFFRSNRTAPHRMLSGYALFIHYTEFIKDIKKEIPSRIRYSTQDFIKYLQTAKLSFFCNNFERNFNRNFLVKFDDCFVVTNFLHCILNNDNLTIDVVTQFSKFFSNLNITY